MVKVLCESDAAAKTDEFIGFCGMVAIHAAGLKAGHYDAVKNEYPQIEQYRKTIQNKLKEKVEVDQIIFMSL